MTERPEILDLISTETVVIIYTLLLGDDICVAIPNTTLLSNLVKPIEMRKSRENLSSKFKLTKMINDLMMIDLLRREILLHLRHLMT